MFPPNEDCNTAVNYLRELKKKWPKMYFKPEIENVKDLDSGTPKLKALHIVYPWSATVMKALSASLFCDATFQVTVYNYKVVCITTLDGNKHVNNNHR